MDENAGRIDVGHDAHEVDGLVVRDRFDLKGVDETAMRVTRISDAADDRDRHLLDTHRTIEGIDGADQAGGITRGELEVVAPHAVLVVCVSVEEHVCDLGGLAALEDGFDACRFVLLFVLRSDAARRRVEHDVDLGDEVIELSGNRDSGSFQRLLCSRHCGVHGIGHAAFGERSHCECWCDVGNTDQLHVLLPSDTVCETLSDHSESGHSDFDFAHV